MVAAAGLVRRSRTINGTWPAKPLNMQALDRRAQVNWRYLGLQKAHFVEEEDDEKKKNFAANFSDF